MTTPSAPCVSSMRPACCTIGPSAAAPVAASCPKGGPQRGGVGQQASKQATGQCGGQVIQRSLSRLNGYRLQAEILPECHKPGTGFCVTFNRWQWRRGRFVRRGPPLPRCSTMTRVQRADMGAGVGAAGDRTSSPRAPAVWTTSCPSPGQRSCTPRQWLHRARTGARHRRAQAS